jgi:ferredoxin
MAYVITDACVGTKDTACVDICPCDCIHPTAQEPGFDRAEQLYIDPDHCIDCGLCVDECPAKAIFQDMDLPVEKAHFTQVNADWFKRL